MKTIKTKIIIDAPLSKVWNILMDHSSYPSWNPFLLSISGSTQVGETISVSFHQENKKPMVFKPVVLKNETNSEFRWLGHLFVKGLFDGEHYFKLESISDNQTRFIHGENFTGLMAGVILKMIGDSTLKGFNNMNKAIKIRAEKNN